MNAEICEATTQALLDMASAVEARRGVSAPALTRYGTALRNAASVITALEQEVERLRGDARRYAWLCDATRRDWCVSRDAPRGGVYQYFGRELDAAIDAMQTEQPDGQ